MLIKIVTLLLLFIFIVYLSKKKEGLMNQYIPISIRKTDEDYIYRKMITTGDVLYDKKFTLMKEADVISDMSYFNNATSILYTLGKYSVLP
jgi:hypothetical protein